MSEVWSAQTEAEEFSGAKGKLVVKPVTLQRIQRVAMITGHSLGEVVDLAMVAMQNCFEKHEQIWKEEDS